MHFSGFTALRSNKFIQIANPNQIIIFYWLLQANADNKLKTKVSYCMGKC